MNNTELYINGRLCDLTKDFGVRLNRRLIKPGELNTKDAQYSYSITLPGTQNNDEIFNFSGVEETRNKFNTEYRAELIINSVQVFKGMFLMTAITRTTYRGNLYIPGKKSIKDIFGEVMLSDNPPYLLRIDEFADAISNINIAAAEAIQPAIFPYVLYGLLPKVSNLVGEFSDHTIWDEFVRIGIQDLPPSVNVIKMLEHIFESRGYNLSGTALTDPRLTNLYMSYKNDPSYVQPWNYGRLGRMSIVGSWSNFKDMGNAGSSQLERGVTLSYSEDAEFYSTDIFNSNNSNINVLIDEGLNILKNEVADDDNRLWRRMQIAVPTSGYYKINLKGNMMLDKSDFHATDDTTDMSFIGAGDLYSNFGYMFHGLKLLRDRNKGDFNLGSSGIDGTLYKNNLPQNNEYTPDYAPKYIPHYDENGIKNFVDLAQNENYIVGFQWGRFMPSEPKEGYKSTAQINIAKPATSWDGSRTNDYRNRIVMHNPVGYDKWALPTNSENEDDPPVWGTSERFKYVVANSPDNFSKLGTYENQPGDERYTAQGEANCIVWLEAGELLTLVDTSVQGLLAPEGFNVYRGWVAKQSSFVLDIEPFRSDIEWLNINSDGKQIGDIDWNDAGNFEKSDIDLVKFLPTDMKTDDFIENFCKAFNLRITQTGTNNFELDVKQDKRKMSNRYIDLDMLSSVRFSTNTPLGIPSLYKLGFTIDPEEKGYVDSGEDGGGEYPTGALGGDIIEQKSAFSYNWFLDITKDGVTLSLPVISKAEVWDTDTQYSEEMLRRFTNLGIRFWYYDGLLNDLGVSFMLPDGRDIKLAKVSNVLPNLNTLNYKDESLTILDNYFTLLTDGSSNYTDLECYPTPDQYEALNGVIKARFNGDIYYVGELEGYDPYGRNKTKIKLIRRI